MPSQNSLQNPRELLPPLHDKPSSRPQTLNAPIGSDRATDTPYSHPLVRVPRAPCVLVRLAPSLEVLPHSVTAARLQHCRPRITEGLAYRVPMPLPALSSPVVRPPPRQP